MITRALVILWVVVGFTVLACSGSALELLSPDEMAALRGGEVEYENSDCGPLDFSGCQTIGGNMLCMTGGMGFCITPNYRNPYGHQHVQAGDHTVWGYLDEQCEECDCHMWMGTCEIDQSTCRDRVIEEECMGE